MTLPHKEKRKQVRQRAAKHARRHRQDGEAAVARLDHAIDPLTEDQARPVLEALSAAQTMDVISAKTSGAKGGKKSVGARQAKNAIRDPELLQRADEIRAKNPKLSDWRIAELIFDERKADEKPNPGRYRIWQIITGKK